MKRFIFFLLPLTVAATPVAAESDVQVAYVDKTLPLQKKSDPPLPMVTEKEEFYEITGSCEKDLRGQLRRNGIRWSDGKKYDSVTRWSVRWDFPDREAGTCTPSSFKVNVDIRTRYPKWTRPDDAPAPLAEKWDAYLKNLVTHENGHRDMVVAAAADLSQAVSELPPGLSCDELYRKACDLCCERMRKLKKEEKEYDELTIHGALQGAVFP